MNRLKTQAELKPPTDLSPPARALWRLVLADFVLESHHLVILAEACKCLTRINQAEAKIKTDGLFVEDRFGQKREHPAAETEAKNRRLFKSYLRELQLDVEPADHGYDRAPRLAECGRQTKRA